MHCPLAMPSHFQLSPFSRSSLAALAGASILAGCATTPPPASAPGGAASAARSSPIAEAARVDCRADVTSRQRGYRAMLGTGASAEAVVRRILADCGRDDAVELTSRLVGFQTIAAIAPIPSHPQFKAMASYLEQWARDAGLQFRVVGEHDAWEVTLAGRNPGRQLALITHGDVVPVNDPPVLIEPATVPAGWTTAPFQAVVKDGKLYGRGTEDDKAPIAAVLLAMRELRAAGIVPDKDITLVIGTAEEDKWEGMRRYASSAPKAAYTISLDADYPAVVAQSGFVSWGIRAPVGQPPRAGRNPWIRELHGGLFLTQVPDLAWMIVEPRGETLARLRERVDGIVSEELQRRASAHQTSYSVHVEEAGARQEFLKVTVRGASVHASVAEEGHNALWPLASIAMKIGVAQGGVHAVLSAIAGEFDGDHHGERLGIAYEDPFMGKLLVAPTVLRMQEGFVSLGVNMRRPRGKTSDQFKTSLQSALELLRKRHGGTLGPIDDIWVGEPHAIDPSSATVSRLMQIFEDLTGQKHKPRSLRGGTYAKLFEGAVDFGPGMVGRPYTGHGADEFIALDAIELSVRAAGELVLRLGCGSQADPTVAGR